MVNAIGIIPARGNSKRIPKKNIIEFDGEPMISRTIKVALESKIFSKLIVSTDNLEIAEVSKKYGAEVPFLRDKYADSLSTSSQATLHALMQAEKFYEMKFDIVCQLMPNCPLRTTSDIVGSFNAFKKNDRNFQISVIKYGWLNPWWAQKRDLEGFGKELFPNQIKKRSQDLESLYCPTGSIWFAKSNLLKKFKTFYGDRYNIEPLANWLNGIDIDDYNDLEMARAIYMHRKINKL
tara:strand:+ start:1611 stop:2318 length:708 start_codon:yes stop_codon:yes gene_type:complete